MKRDGLVRRRSIERVGRLPLRVVLAVFVSMLVPSMAGAAVTISIAEPQFGVPTHPTPHIRVVYSSDAGPLDLTSLRIRIGGEDVTSRFAVTAGAATYTIGVADSLIAGTVTLSAEIRDGASPPASASTTQIYEVLPTLVDFTPAEGRAGDEMQVEVLGLDPDASRNVVEFAPCVERPLAVVDRPNRRGRLTVPAAFSGQLRVIVNGKASEKHERPFYFPPVVAAGQEHSLFATQSGTAYGMGRNSRGQLGIRSVTPRVPLPTPIAFPSSPPLPPPKVRALAGGARHSLGVTEDGQAWAWGHNVAGQLGDGTVWDIIRPKRILEGYRIRAVAALIDTSFALTCEGELLSFGWNGVGELGIGTIDYVAHPNPVQVLTGIQAVSGNAGAAWTMALADSGAVYGWGWNVTGQAANGSYGEYYPAPISIPMNGIRRISSGGAHSLTVAEGSGAVFGWGVDAGGQVGNGQADNPPGTGYYRVLAPAGASGLVADEISAGDTHSLAVTSDGLVMQWGAIPISDTTFRKVYAPELVPALSEMVAVAGGSDFSLAWKADGTLWTWGYNGTGALGDGTFVGRQTPEPVFGCPGASSRPGGGSSSDPSLPTCPPEEDEVEILPAETTRWKPQRGDQPIVVTFEGPADLTPQTMLEITDPEGNPVVSPSLTFEEVPPDAEPQKYRITWSGPWTRSSGTPLPSGNYTVKVKGVRPDGSPLYSDPYNRISFVEVKEVRLESLPGAPPPDGNPGPGGGVPAAGKRIFAEAVDPIEVDASQPVYDRVRVVATVEPPIPDPAPQGPVRVFFRPLDVDDPAPNGLIDNEALVNDNKGPAASLTDENGVEVLGATLVSIPVPNDQAQTILRTSGRQGDNYRVAASTNDVWPTRLSVVTGSQTGEVVHATDAALPEGVQLTEMLTVWRTLHVERRRMQPLAGFAQSDFDVENTWTGLSSSRLRDNNTDFLNAPTSDGTNPIGTVDHTNNNDWRGSDLNPDASGGRDFPVTGNGRYTVNVSGNMCTVMSGGSCSVTPTSYYLRDDKLMSLTGGSHDLSALEPILRELYITVHAWDPADAEPLKRNLTGLQHDAMNGTATNSVAYWNVPLLLAFEGELGRDYDRTNEGCTSTQCSGPTAGRCKPGAQPLAAVFTESIRDFAETAPSCVLGRRLRPTVSLGEYLASNSAHELLHGMGLGHAGDGTGAIMCAEVKNFVETGDSRLRITEAQKAQLRAIAKPSFDPSGGSCPQSPACP